MGSGLGLGLGLGLGFGFRVRVSGRAAAERHRSAELALRAARELLGALVRVLRQAVARLHALHLRAQLGAWSGVRVRARVRVRVRARARLRVRVRVRLRVRLRVRVQIRVRVHCHLPEGIATVDQLVGPPLEAALARAHLSVLSLIHI